MLVFIPRRYDLDELTLDLLCFAKRYSFRNSSSSALMRKKIKINGDGTHVCVLTRVSNGMERRRSDTSTESIQRNDLVFIYIYICTHADKKNVLNEPSKTFSRTRTTQKKHTYVNKRQRFRLRKKIRSFYPCLVFTLGEESAYVETERKQKKKKKKKRQINI